MSCQFPLRRTSIVTGSPLPKLWVHLIFRVVPAVQVIPDKLGSVTVTEGVPVTTWKFASDMSNAELSEASSATTLTLPVDVSGSGDGQRQLRRVPSSPVHSKVKLLPPSRE